MSPFLSSTGPTASLSSNLASNKTSSVNQLINRSSNCCGRSLIRPVLSAVWVAASPQCLPLVYITIHFVRSCLLYKGGPRGCGGHRRADTEVRPYTDSRWLLQGPTSASARSTTDAPTLLPIIRHGLRPCHLLPCGAKAITALSGALKCRYPSPHPSRLTPCHLPPGEG